MFKDPDSAGTNSTLQWRISACDSCDNFDSCDRDRLYEGPATTPSFIVRRTLEGTGGPVTCVVVDLDVFDDRGASSSYSQVLHVLDDPTLTLQSRAPTVTRSAPRAANPAACSARPGA